MSILLDGPYCYSVLIDCYECDILFAFCNFTFIFTVCDTDLCSGDNIQQEEDTKVDVPLFFNSSKPRSDEVEKVISKNTPTIV